MGACEAGAAPPFATSDTDAKLRMDCLNAGRAAVKRREVALRLAIVIEWSVVDCLSDSKLFAVIL